MEWAQNASIRSSIGSQEIVRHDVKYTRIILTLVKFMHMLTNMVESLLKYEVL